MNSLKIGWSVRAIGLLAVVVLATPAMADINLEWRPIFQDALVGDPNYPGDPNDPNFQDYPYRVDIGLYAVSSDPNQYLAAVEVILTWDPNYLQLLGNDDTGGASWLSSGFPKPDIAGLNEVRPPQDGDGLYQAWANWGVNVPATAEGTLLTTFQFAALHGTGSTSLNIEAAWPPPPQDPVQITVVWDGFIPEHDVTGTLGPGAEVAITCMECLGDVNRDGIVDIEDLGWLLPNYGTSGGMYPSDGDVDCDGDVDISDLGWLLPHYGQLCD